MKKSLYGKTRTPMIIMALIAACMGLAAILFIFILRGSIITIGERFGTAAAEDGKAALETQIEMDLLQFAQDKAVICDDDIYIIMNYTEQMSHAATIAYSEFGEDTASLEMIKSFMLSYMVGAFPELGCYYATEQGGFLISDTYGSNPPEGFDPRTRVWYIDAKEKNALIWTDVYEDMEGRGLAITCAKPFYSSDGNIAGVAGIGAFINNIKEVVVGTRLGETGYSFISNERGEVIISDTVYEREDGTVYRPHLSDIIPPMTAKNIQRGKSGIERAVISGADCFVAYAPLETLPWNLVMIIETDEVFRPAVQSEEHIMQLSAEAINDINRMMYFVLGVFAVMIATSVTIGLIMSHRLAHALADPLQKLAEDAAVIGSGNLDHVLEIKTDDELEILVNAFNSMISDIKTTIAEKQRIQNDALRAQETNQLKSQFIANMSHEIRTPMNAILGIAEIQLQHYEHPPETEEAFGQICDSGALMLNIINDILDMAKIEEGKLEIIPAKYDIPSLVSDSVQLNSLRYESKPLKLLVNVDENTPRELIGDEMRIRQVLNNLLSNAFKYTGEGEIELSVSPDFEGASDVDDVTLIISVRDTGQGMTQSQIEVIFNEFTRFNLDTNRAIVGTGLGMSITKRLVEMMNGEINVESEPGKGTVFTIRLPQKRVNGVICGKELVNNLKTFSFKSKSRIKKSRAREYINGSVLIVDDMHTNLLVAKGLLLPYKLHVETLMSGSDTIAALKEGRVYDIIFMDHMMPGMDGVEATKIIRGMGYKKPIIALTANAMAEHKNMFLESGFDGYLSKPIDSRELDLLLKEHVRDKEIPEVV